MRRILLLAAVGAAWICAQTPADRSWSILEGGIGNKSADTRVKAVRALGLITNNAKAQQMAERALADAKPEVKAAAAEALGQMGARASAPRLIEALKTKETEVVFAAANALYVLGDPRAYEVYYAVLTGQRKSGEGLVESQMKMLKDPKAIAQMGFEQGIGFIPFAGIGYSVFKGVTKDDASPVRAAAAQKLVRDPDPKTTAALMQYASDSKWLVRAAVVDAIAKRGDPALMSALWPLLDDSNETVRFSAAATILRLTKPPSAPGASKSAPKRK
jgi:HEAT repeat protein